MEKAKKKIQEKAIKIYSKDLVEVIFANPYCKAKFLEEAGLGGRQTAATYLKALEEMGLLKGKTMDRNNSFFMDIKDPDDPNDQSPIREMLTLGNQLLIFEQKRVVNTPPLTLTIKGIGIGCV